MLIDNDPSNCAIQYDYLSRYMPICNNHGNCVDSLCYCDQGWSGRSDWIDTDGYDCQINYLAIRILWGVNLFILVSVFIYSVPQYIIIYKRYRDIKSSRKERGQKYGLSDNKGMFYLVVAYSTWAPAHIALGVLKIYDPTYRVAIDIIPTILWYISRTGFHLSAPIFQPTLLDNMMKGASATTGGTEKLVSMNYKFSWFLACAMAIIPLIAIPNMIFYETNPLLSRICLVCYFSFQAFALLLYAGQAAIIRNKIANILDDSYSFTNNIRTRDVKMNLTNMQKEVIRQATLQGILYTLFAALPIMWNKHDYILPIVHMSIPLVIMKSTLAVSGIKKDLAARRETMMISRSDTTTSMASIELLGPRRTTNLKQQPTWDTTPIREEDEILHYHQDTQDHSLIPNPSFKI